MFSLVSKFDPTKEEHVMWLKRSSDGFKRSMREKYDFMTIVNDKTVCSDEVKPQDWAHLHFVLAVKYTDAVFDGTAYIPK